MQKTSRSSSQTRHAIRWAAAIAATAVVASAAGCRSEVLGPDGDGGSSGGSKPAAHGGSAGKPSGAGAGNAAGSTVATTGGAATAAGAGGGSGGSVTATGGMGTGGTVVSTGGMSAGGTGGSAGMMTAGMGGAGKACVDVEPPPDPDWPDATCAKWAAETTECSASWFATYCDVSCGRCVPSSGSGGGGGMGSGGMSSGGMGGKPCVDVEPPPDPDWPDATCESWALETTECSASWFASYCDVSCKRCVPEGSGGSAGTPAVDCSTMGLPQVSGGNGYATRYWDCCQTHCSQQTGHRCGQDGVSSTGDQNSSCNGGGSFACYDEAPRAVNDCLSYGNIAKANPNCGGCYRIQFTGEGQYSATDPGSKAIKGKQMIVKVTNTGGDVASNQFDLMVPGGGVGQNNACSRQWGTSDLGAQYGGFLTNCKGTYSEKKECVRQNCMKIPAGKARDGCIWFIDWFQIADNPKFTSQQTDCPF